MDCSPPGSSVHGIPQARILERVAISSSKGPSRPRDRTCVSCLGRRILYHWATREALKPSWSLANWDELVIVQRLPPHLLSHQHLSFPYHFTTDKSEGSPLIDIIRMPGPLLGIPWLPGIQSAQAPCEGGRLTVLHHDPCPLFSTGPVISLLAFCVSVSHSVMSDSLQSRGQ